MTDHNQITTHILDCAFRIHTKLGPGLMESVYETILARDLVRLGHSVQRQKPISFAFEGLWFDNACRVDLAVDDAVLVEIKAVATLPAGCERQLFTYLKLLDYRVGLLLNFGAAYLRDGIKRIANDF